MKTIKLAVEALRREAENYHDATDRHEYLTQLADALEKTLKTRKKR